MKHCLNWKVLAGLAAVGVGIWVMKPALITAALPLLIVAACPLSMLFMMRGMGNMSGMGGGQCASQPQQVRQPDEANQPLWPDLTCDEQLAQLKAQATTLQAQHEVIAREIAELEAANAPVLREAVAVARAADERVRG